MHLQQINSRLAYLSESRSLQYVFNPPASNADILNAEIALNIHIPEQIRHFYQHFNGLLVDQPRLEILPIQQFKFLARGRLHFATVDGQHQLCFDTSELNEAGQWNILTFDTNYKITFTMASFWSNRLWTWLEKHRSIWQAN